jgi:hypothetical protein
LFLFSIVGSLTGWQVTGAFVAALITGWVAEVMSRKIYDRRCKRQNFMNDTVNLLHLTAFNGEGTNNDVFFCCLHPFLL